jgi:hypothetical protein
MFTKQGMHAKKRTEIMMHLAVTAYAILLSAALASAQHNPQTDSPHPAPRPQSGENTVTRNDGSSLYINNEMMVGGGAPPKQKTETPDYAAMASSMAQNLFNPTPKMLGTDGGHYYVVGGSQQAVESLCMGSSGAEQVQCQAWNDKGVLIKMTCYPSGCMVDDVFNVRE